MGTEAIPLPIDGDDDYASGEHGEEEPIVPLEIDAPHRHGLLTLLKRRIGRTEGAVCQ